MDEFVLDLAADKYHASPGISNSALKVFHESPRDYWAQFIGHTVTRKETAAMDFGSVVHSMILEPDLLSSVAVPIPAGVLNKDGHKKGKAWTDFKSTLNGRLPMKPEECDRLTEIHNAVYGNEVANGLLQHKGHSEVSIFWQNILVRRSRLDRFAPPYILDVKTTEQISRWVHTAGDLAYYRQAAYYLDAARHIHSDIERFIFIVVQTVAPFHVRCFEYDADSLGLAMSSITADLIDLKGRIFNDDWHDDRELGINQISIPRWKK